MNPKTSIVIEFVKLETNDILNENFAYSSRIQILVLLSNTRYFRWAKKSTQKPILEWLYIPWVGDRNVIFLEDVISAYLYVAGGLSLEKNT